MDPRIEKVLKILERNGWKAEGVLQLTGEWWFEDIYHFVSHWRPTEKDLYITLLTDPQITRSKIVWSIGISTIVPATRQFAFLAQIALNDVRRKDLQQWVEEINKEVLR